MYKTSKQLKQDAAQALSGKWGIVVLMMLTMGLISVPFAMLTEIDESFVWLSYVVSFLSIILNVGITSFLMKICCGQKQQAVFSDLFYGFKCHPGKALLLYLLTILYMIPGAIVYAILLVVFMFVFIAGSGMSLSQLLYSDISDAYLVAGIGGFVVVFLLLTILYAIYAYYIQYTYGLVYYLLLDYPDLPTGQIWKRSAQLMKGNRLRRLKLDLSFLPWFLGLILGVVIGCFNPILLIVVLLLCIPFCFALSIYISTASVEFYLDLVQNQPYQGSVDNDTNLTHTCEETHSNMYENNGQNYTGIDPNTFN